MPVAIHSQPATGPRFGTPFPRCGILVG